MVVWRGGEHVEMGYKQITLEPVLCARDATVRYTVNQSGWYFSTCCTVSTVLRSAGAAKKTCSLSFVRRAEPTSRPSLSCRRKKAMQMGRLKPKKQYLYILSYESSNSGTSTT